MIQRLVFSHKQDQPGGVHVAYVNEPLSGRAIVNKPLCGRAHVAMLTNH